MHAQNPQVIERIFVGLKYAFLEKNFIQVSSAITFVLLVTHLSLKDFGLLNLLFSVVAPGTAIVFFGLERLIVADIAVLRAKGEHSVIRRLLLEYGGLIAVLYVLLFIFAWFFRLYVSRYYDADLTPFYWALVLLVSGQVLMNYTSIIFEAHEGFKASFWSKWAESFIRLLLAIACLLWVGFSLYSALWIYVIAKVCAGLGSLAYVFAARTFEFNAQKAASAPQLLNIVKRHGKWETITSYLMTFADSISPWLVYHFVSTEAVGLLAFAQRVNTFASNFIPIRSVFFPILSNVIRTSREHAVQAATIVKKYLTIFAAGFCIVVWLSIDYIILWIQPEYLASAWLIRLAVLHLFIDVLTVGQATVLYAFKKQKVNFHLRVTIGVLSVLMQLAFVPVWGATGSIVAWLLIGVGNGVWREIALHRAVGISLFAPKDLLRSFMRYDTEYDLVVRATLLKYLRTFQKLLPPVMRS